MTHAELLRDRRDWPPSDCPGALEVSLRVADRHYDDEGFLVDRQVTVYRCLACEGVVSVARATDYPDTPGTILNAYAPLPPGEMVRSLADSLSIHPKEER